MALFRKKQQDSPGRRTHAGDAFERESSVQRPQQSFLRNRTLSGVSRPAIEDSSRSQLHTLTRRRRKVGTIFLLIAAVTITLLLLIAQFTPDVTLTLRSNTGTAKLDGKIYQKTINEYLDHHPVERLRFALSDDSLSAYVASVNPEVKRVEQVTRWGIGPTTYSLTLREPVAGWQIAGQQYYVDDQGVAFAVNLFEAPTVQIIDSSGVSLENGATVTSTRFLGFIGKVVSVAKGRGYTVTEAILPLNTTREVDIRLAEYGALVKLSVDRGAGEQMEDLSRSIQHLTSRGQAPGYIDLRVAGRAYYQ